jgi:hypothetical protein
MRRTTRPLSTREVALALMKARGLNIVDLKIVRTIQQRTVACLGHWKRRGYLKSSPGPGAKGALLPHARIEAQTGLWTVGLQRTFPIGTPMVLSGGFTTVFRWNSAS